MFFRRNQNLLHQCFVANHQYGHSISTKKSLYDILQISPKATKSDIKKSYYRLSLIYHPDQNQGNESAALKFREITEAYEVLGNVMKRRLYDKGLYGVRGTMSSDSTADPEVYSKFYRPSKKSPSVGRTQIYDFDAWSRFHYSQNFERKQREKNMSSVQEEYKSREDKRSAGATLSFIFLIMVIGLVNLKLGDNDIAKFHKSLKKDR